MFIFQDGTAAVYLPHMPSPTGDVPSGAALRRAERSNADAGHENLGFLSESHGFLPVEPPRLRLPDSHRAWDETAARLPELWRTVAVREAIEELPLLDVGVLDDRDLWRASCLVSILAHSYVRSETRPYGELPPSIRRPWQELADRLGRPRPFLSYNDLIVYNWRLREPGLDDPMRVENLELLVPTVGNQAERVFYLTQVEISAQCAPIVGAVVRAQRAAARDDPAALAEELLLVLERLRHITEVSFQKIDQNPLSPTYVDPVVWATTVAPFAVPIDDTAGPSGTSAAVFHLLDAFLGRRRFDSFLGRELVHLQTWFPPHHRAFLAAVDEVSVRDYVSARGDRALAGLFSTVLEAYAGPRGYLGVHRLKVYGYLELAFKVGRAVTIGGFSGAFRERAWKEVDGELDASRRERLEAFGAPRHGVVRGRRPLGAAAHRVTVDVSAAGVPYRPGDHLRVLPENTPELVERTLAALRAEGGERVPLTPAWREALRSRAGFEAEAPTHLPLRELLRYAKLRPLLRPVGKSLAALTSSVRLDAILEARQEDQWELWDALELLAADGYDTQRLWRSQLWQDESIARIVPPEPFRTYSVASAPDGPVPRTLDLTVARLEYEPQRHGTASTFLTANGDGPTAVDIVRPGRFRLPEDPARPIVMVAGGTGIAPFRAFLQERVQRGAPGENWLFLGIRTRDELLYRDELEELVEDGRLELRVALSREEPRAHVPDVMEREENAAELWRLVGAGASVYICGRAAFAHAVTEALVNIAARFGDGDGRAFLRRLVAERRLMQDVFTTFAAHTAPGVGGAGLYDASELVLHNDDERGHWLAIDGNVYDVTEFMHLHPGGPATLRENVGLDASREWRAVLHHESSEVSALLPAYKIGTIRRLDLGARWGIALVPGAGVVYMPLRDLFRAWVRYLYLVVEMENALRNDFRYLQAALTEGDDPAEINRVKVQYAANTHARFLEAYLDGSTGDDLHRLFSLTVGLCAPDEPVHRLRRQLDALRETPEARAMRDFSERARLLYVEADPEQGRRFCALVQEHDRRFLAELKLAVREGVRVFEELEAAAIDEGASRIVAALDAVPDVVSAYFKRFTDAQARVP
jgi:ferredoxin-NADP reductase/cytochrome b involved in lipid metabolism